MKKKTIFKQGYSKYYRIELPNNVAGNVNVNAEALYRFIGEHKPYRKKGYIGSAYKQIRIKTDKALNLTVFDGILRTSKREVASVLTYYRYFTNHNDDNEYYVKIPYKIVYIFGAIKELVDEIRAEGHNIPAELNDVIGMTYRVAFYKNHTDAYESMKRSEMVCDAQLELRDDFVGKNSPLNQIFG